MNLLLRAASVGIAALSFATALPAGAAPAAAAKKLVTLTQGAASTFHITGWQTAYDPNQCFVAYYDDALNSCADTTTLRWSLPMNAANAGVAHSVTLRSGSHYFATPFSCGVWPGDNTGLTDYPTTITFTGTSQDQSVTLKKGSTYALVTCDLPPGDSLATLTWTQ